MELRGISDIEGKAAKGSGERAGKRASFKSVSLLWREGGDDFLKARIAAAHSANRRWTGAVQRLPASL
jgi:hypothetical protein